MSKLWRWLFLCVISMALIGCVAYPYSGVSQRSTEITNPETGETSIVDTIEETSVPAPWVGLGAPTDWVFGIGGWEYLGVPYVFYGGVYNVWGPVGLYGPGYIYRSNYWYNQNRWYGYRGQGAAWRGYNGRWSGGHNYHGQGYRGQGGRGNHPGGTWGRSGQRPGNIQGNRPGGGHKTVTGRPASPTIRSGGGNRPQVQRPAQRPASRPAARPSTNKR